MDRMELVDQEIFEFIGNRLPDAIRPISPKGNAARAILLETFHVRFNFSIYVMTHRILNVVHYTSSCCSTPPHDSARSLECESEIANA